jgi:uncharacterized protein (DUF952 family)
MNKLQEGLMPDELMIYHLVSKDMFVGNHKNGFYESANFKTEGFIHCSCRANVVDIANDYYSSADDLILIKIDTCLLVSPLKYEEPADINGQGNPHFETGIKFPHIYGPINDNSVIGIAKMKKNGGSYEFPSRFDSIEIYS